MVDAVEEKRPLEVPSGQSREETRQTELIDLPRFSSVQRTG
jgi:hypothetical protein